MPRGSHPSLVGSPDRREEHHFPPLQLDLAEAARLCLRLHPRANRGHRHTRRFVFEKNDAFFVIGAIPSIALFYFGVNPELNYKFFIGLGVLGYGITYFMVHDVLIHQRFKWFKHTKNWYLLGLRKAHKIHHKKLMKHDGECFGMLYVPLKYFRKPQKK